MIEVPVDGRKSVKPVGWRVIFEGYGVAGRLHRVPTLCLEIRIGTRDDAIDSVERVITKMRPTWSSWGLISAGRTYEEAED